MQSYAQRLEILNTPKLYSSLRGIKRGIEREALRVDATGGLSKKPHPEALGSSLTHPFITTDYSEALLEFITEPTTDFNAMFQQLKELHQVAYLALPDEYLWTASMPCRIPVDNEIPIAEYGYSNLGKLKRLYRDGLGYRYGRAMQTIAGIHYNFSLPIEFWEQYRKMQNTQESAETSSLAEFISEQYLGMIRNILRHGWLLTLLFGASPAVSSSFFNSERSIPDFLELAIFDKETFIAHDATSLRLSHLGYHNKSSMDTVISYNSLHAFLNTMHHVIHTPDPTYAQIGVKEKGQYKQLSDGVLQTEDEHYAMVRPKSKVNPGERQWVGLKKNGIEYLEIRALDINPFVPLGIDETTARVIDAFLMMCLTEYSPVIMPTEMDEILSKQECIAREGRRLSAHQKAANECLLKMLDMSKILDKANNSHCWESACAQMLKNIEYPDSLPSARVLNHIMEQKTSHVEYVLQCSRHHRQALLANPLTPKQITDYRELAKHSHTQQRLLEQQKNVSFDDYLHEYLRL